MPTSVTSHLEWILGYGGWLGATAACIYMWNTPQAERRDPVRRTALALAPFLGSIAFGLGILCTSVLLTTVLNTLRYMLRLNVLASVSVTLIIGGMVAGTLSDVLDMQKHPTHAEAAEQSDTNSESGSSVSASDSASDAASDADMSGDSNESEITAESELELEETVVLKSS